MSNKLPFIVQSAAFQAVEELSRRACAGITVEAGEVERIRIIDSERTIVTFLPENTHHVKIRDSAPIAFIPRWPDEAR